LEPRHWVCFVNLKIAINFKDISAQDLHRSVFVMQGKMVEEEQFNVSLPQILEMIFLDVNLYIAVFWAGDQEFCDKGTFVHIHISTDGDCLDVRFVPVHTIPELHKCKIESASFSVI
jgi:hypothetical protein